MKPTAALFACLSLMFVVSSWKVAEPTRDVSGAAYVAGANAGMIAIREITLKPGADAQAFEQFVATEFVPTTSQYWPGADVMVVKGERGQNVGQYLLVYVFDSKDVRDLYFPEPDQPSEVWQAIIEHQGDAYVPVNQKFNDYATISETYTDYVAVE